jgi:hypothetical protein
MIRVSWSFINLGACTAAGAAILAPLFPYALSSMLSGVMPDFFDSVILDPSLALAISAVIAVVLTVIFYRIAINNARKLLAKAEI